MGWMRKCRVSDSFSTIRGGFGTKSGAIVEKTTSVDSLSRLEKLRLFLIFFHLGPNYRGTSLSV